MDQVDLYKNLEKTVSHTEDVEIALRKQTAVLASAARARLARHRKTGDHHITTTKGSIDHFVNLEGAASMAVEEGWFTDGGRFVDGLHVLGHLIGREGGR